MLTLIFSKDRPMQLDATLRSFRQHSQDKSQVVVLYKATSEETDRGYLTLLQVHEWADFTREGDFKADVLGLLKQDEYICFVVDDALFIRPFSFQDIVGELKADNTLLGCSLRNGSNVTYNYPYRCPMRPGKLFKVGNLFKYNWTDEVGGNWDGYPLEVSSSVYASDLVYPILAGPALAGPNPLEYHLAVNAHKFKETKPWLLCYEHSAAFCAPVNRVNVGFNNRAGSNPDYSPEALTARYNKGQRIDLRKFENFSPTSYHQEVEFTFLT